MQETIATAREKKDMACLNYSLSWLYHFGKSHPEQMAEIRKKGALGSERETLAFLKAKAKETHMWSLLSTLLLSEAKFVLSNVCSSELRAFKAPLAKSHVGRQCLPGLRKCAQSSPSQHF